MVSSPAARSGNPVPEWQVAEMFDSIAPVYDVMNTLMSGGFDGRWRRAAARATALRRGGVALDVACGTGKLTREVARRAGPDGHVTGLDIAPAMVATARRDASNPRQVEFVVGSALDLPFASASFDAATIAFGLRNLASFERGFGELARVVRPGGRVVCLELALPRPDRLGRVYWRLFRSFAPALGRLFGRPAAYRYLPESLDGFPDPAGLASIMRSVGLRRVTVRRLALGAVVLLAAEVPATTATTATTATAATTATV